MIKEFKMYLNKQLIFNLSLYIIIIINFIIEYIQTYYYFSITTLLIFYSIQFFLIIFSCYKYLLKGFIVSTFFNVISSMSFYLKYYTEHDSFYLEMIYFRMITLILSLLIYFLSMKHEKFINSNKTGIYVDTLTGLFNNRYFYECLDLEIRKAKRTNRHIGLIMIDIDNFRKFNNTLGHKEGDKLLKQTTEILKSTSRIQDTISRYEADIFVLIIPDVKENQIITTIQDIRDRFSVLSTTLFEKTGFNTTISIGYSLFPILALNGDDLISQAENALYKAKQTGRNNVKVYKDVFDNIKEYFNSTESQLITSLKTILSAISAKDRYTLGHSERVMEYVISLGKEMNLNDDDLKILKIAALVHDIGKIEIPQYILNKRERLTDEEFSMLKKHPIYSAEIIEPLSKLSKLDRIVKHHHERFDGHGYPDGIKGEDILLEARILTVADSFDAMLSNRPYRDPLSLEQAIHELKNNSGSQFDSNIINAFLQILGRGEYYDKLA